jgi:hypothetical protein
MREPSTRQMLAWISKTWDMGPDALARMFHQNRQTIEAWMHSGRISMEGDTKIRSSFSFLTRRRPPLTERTTAGTFLP